MGLGARQIRFRAPGFEAGSGHLQRSPVTGLGRTRVLDLGFERHLLTEEQFGALDPSVGVETANHGVGAQSVAQGEKDHALVVSHVRAHDLVIPSAEARWREVNRFEKAVLAYHLQFDKAVDVLHHLLRRH